MFTTKSAVVAGKRDPQRRGEHFRAMRDEHPDAVRRQRRAERQCGEAVGDQPQRRKMSAERQKDQRAHDHEELADHGHGHAALRVHQHRKTQAHAHRDRLTRDDQRVEQHLKAKADRDAEQYLLCEQQARHQIRLEPLGRRRQHRPEHERDGECECEPDARRHKPRAEHGRDHQHARDSKERQRVQCELARQDVPQNVGWDRHAQPISTGMLLISDSE
jgi:hypothetical protein